MMHIGEVARAVGVRASAIRYYEAQGIIQPALRNTSGYRFYSDDAVNLLGFVKRAQSLGLTLKEVKSLLQLSCNDGGRCNQAKRLVREHIQEIDHKMGQLQRLRTDLQALLHRKVRRLRKNEICPIIEA